MIQATVTIIHDPRTGGGISVIARGTEQLNPEEREILDLFYVAIGGLAQDLKTDPRFKNVELIRGEIPEPGEGT